ncbi:uncharacterized protein [Spinacia oleracea]|uniref:Uncharacterized protein isoform X2 n=1 Tax=Spinacia oleracea TaxID=3562 RepID=A0A9R0J3W1_SPIOL|nr:uncharacterized protein LOC110799287 isoform X2 [Spinacia oleracea]
MDFGKLSRSSTSSPFDCVMFDLDDTLYSSHTGIGLALKQNIQDFLVEKRGFTTDQASSLRVELFKSYGSTLAGLRALGYDVDADDYHSFVHGRLPYAQIKPNPHLRNILLSITQRKIIFTNSDRVHATKALNRLGIGDCFEQIICFETLNPNLSMATRPDEIPVVLKPSLDAIQIAISVADINPHRTVGRTTKTQEADYALESVNNLAQAIPEIWMLNGSDKDNEMTIGRSRSDLENLLIVGA